MAYLEELLPEFRQGAKIRQSDWRPEEYIFLDNGICYDEKKEKYSFNESINFSTWELYQESFDWDYVIKNKCLCWFWDDGKKSNSCMGLLVDFNNKEFEYFTNHENISWKHCRPVHKYEVSFYEERKND